VTVPRCWSPGTLFLISVLSPNTTEYEFPQFKYRVTLFRCNLKRSNLYLHCAAVLARARPAPLAVGLVPDVFATSDSFGSAAMRVEQSASAALTIVGCTLHVSGHAWQALVSGDRSSKVFIAVRAAQQAFTELRSKQSKERSAHLSPRAEGSAGRRRHTRGAEHGGRGLPVQLGCGGRRGRSAISVIRAASRPRVSRVLLVGDFAFTLGGWRYMMRI